jgi:hypothetical protein
MKLTTILNEMAAKSLVKQIKPNDRIIMTDNDTLDFKNTTQRPINNGHMKPTGLWYAIGTDWIDWVRSEMPAWEQDHLFKVETTSKVIVLKSPADCKKFEEKFGYEDKYYKREYWGLLIDWELVAKKYAGVELFNYNDHAFHWTYGWDIRSGCIWNKSGIKKITKI